MVVASGRMLRRNVSLADAMDHDLESFGVPATSVVKLLAQRAKHARRSGSKRRARLIQARRWKRVVVVTSNYHACRARFIYGRVLPSSVTLRVSGARDSEFDPSNWWQKTRQRPKGFHDRISSGYLVARWELRTNPAPENKGGFVISPTLPLAQSAEIKSRAQTFADRRTGAPVYSKSLRGRATGHVSGGACCRGRLCCIRGRKPNVFA